MQTRRLCIGLIGAIDVIFGLVCLILLLLVGCVDVVVIIVVVAARVGVGGGGAVGEERMVRAGRWARADGPENDGAGIVVAGVGRGQH